jgi:hypothetical protein
MILTNYISFIKAHEKFLAMVLGAAILFYGFNKAITAYDGHLQRQDQAQVLADQNKLKAAQDQNTLIVGQLAAMQAQFTAANQQLSAQIAAEHQQTIKQQKIDANLTMPDLASRQALLLNLPLKEFTALPTGLTMSPLAAVTTVQQLDTIPELKHTIAAKDEQIKNDEAVIQKQTDVIASDKVVLAAEQKTHTDDVKQLKDTIAIEKKKSFWKGFKYGAGVVGGAAVAITVFVLAK